MLYQVRKFSYQREDLLACARGEMFGPDCARLPMPPMLMMDRITEISPEGGAYGRGFLRAEMDVKPDLWFFDCHFHEDPVMPGCLGLDALWQLLGFYVIWEGGKGFGRALGLKEMSFTGQIMPDARVVEYGVDVKRIIRSKLTMGIADGWVKVDGKSIYTVKDLRIGFFKKEQMDMINGRAPAAEAAVQEAVPA